ncbi:MULTISPECIES: uL23 family ribosomal protein [Candidatus Ichthyocystis]|uniref:Large ribosomal subunit protein uL23 n=1 Tax=Candidatus Ichthyocystis hellenicum TaxID=1561003 RepID=A0A0S4M5D5_9BURK|nr:MULTISPECIES: 50S ribosomal protein L23 [Ichthyocystis]CUT17352.1 50S ribosomal protein L23 [Candidatus Ichthyocystis hellenicum]
MSEVKSFFLDAFKGFVVSEKGGLCSSRFQVTVKVGTYLNKAQIKEAFESLFDVSVEGVTTLNVAGKKKRFGRFYGKRSDWKKAYVSIKDDVRGRSFMERNDGVA